MFRVGAFEIFSAVEISIGIQLKRADEGQSTQIVSWNLISEIKAKNANKRCNTRNTNVLPVNGCSQKLKDYSTKPVIRNWKISLSSAKQLRQLKENKLVNQKLDKHIKGKTKRVGGEHFAIITQGKRVGKYERIVFRFKREVRKLRYYSPKFIIIKGKIE